MSTFVEVNSLEKRCPVIINLDHVIEIAPLLTGGCAIFIQDPAATGGKTAIMVSDKYEQFKQFAMQTVTSDDLAAKISKMPGVSAPKKKPVELDIPKL